jgi:hypothetical protein
MREVITRVGLSGRGPGRWHLELWGGGQASWPAPELLGVHLLRGVDPRAAESRYIHVMGRAYRVTDREASTHGRAARNRGQGLRTG